MITTRPHAGLKFVCKLPDGYDVEGATMKAIGDSRLIVLAPNQPPLMVNTVTGSCDVIDPGAVVPITDMAAFLNSNKINA